jgi:rubredoxin
MEELPVKKWECTVCGYVHEGEKPPAKCPVCGAAASAFKLLDEDEEGKIEAKKPAGKAGKR